MDWISVKDRLPEDGEHVIAYCITPNNDEWHVEPLLYQTTSWTYLFAYNEGYGYASKVSHWMALPQAPNE